MNAVRRSVLFSVLDRYASQVLAVATMAIMARILTPAETGLYLVANAVILLAENFREFGVSAYIVQERTITRTAIQTAFTVTVLLSLAIGVGFFFGGHWIAVFYGEPLLEDLIQVATLSFLIIPFATPIVSVLRREMAFSTLAAINVFAAAANTVVTVSLGLLGFGAMSYIWGYVASTVLIAVVAYLAHPAPWMFRPSFANMRQILSFGTISCSVTLLNLAYDLLPRLALGKLLGFDAVGLYTRALTVCQLPERAIVSALQPVVLPAMAERARNGGDLKSGYLRGFELMSAIQWPTLIMLALLADPIIRILLGSQWGEVPVLVRLIALGSLALAPAFMTYPVLVAAGRVRDTLYASVISIPPSILLMIGAASAFGLNAVAASLLVIAPVQMLIALLFIRRAIGLTWSELSKAARTSATLALGTALIPASVIAMSPTGFDLGWEATLLAILGGAVGWLLALKVSDHPIGEEILAMVRLITGGLRLRLRPAAPTVTPSE